MKIHYFNYFSFDVYLYFRHNSLSIIDLEYPWEIYSSRRLPTKSELPITQWNPKENLIATTVITYFFLID